MNAAIYQAARDAGCTRAEAELLANLVEVDSMKAAAHRAGMSLDTAYNHLARLKKRLGEYHMPALIHKLSTGQMSRPTREKPTVPLERPF